MLVIIALLLGLSLVLNYFAWFKGQDFHMFLIKTYKRTPTYSLFASWMQSPFYLWSVRLVAALSLLTLVLVALILANS